MNPSDKRKSWESLATDLGIETPTAESIVSVTPDTGSSETPARAPQPRPASAPAKSAKPKAKPAWGDLARSLGLDVTDPEPEPEPEPVVEAAPAVVPPEAVIAREMPSTISEPTAAPQFPEQPAAAAVPETPREPFRGTRHRRAEEARPLRRRGEGGAAPDEQEAEAARPADAGGRPAEGGGRSRREGGGRGDGGRREGGRRGDRGRGDRGRSRSEPEARRTETPPPAPPVEPAAESFGGGLFEPREVDPRDIDPRDIDPRDLDPRDIDPRSFGPVDVDPRDIDPRDIDPRDIDPRTVDGTEGRPAAGAEGGRRRRRRRGRGRGRRDGERTGEPRTGEARVGEPRDVPRAGSPNGDDAEMDEPEFVGDGEADFLAEEGELPPGGEPRGEAPAGEAPRRRRRRRRRGGRSGDRERSPAPAGEGEAPRRAPRAERAEPRSDDEEETFDEQDGDALDSYRASEAEQSRLEEERGDDDDIGEFDLAGHRSITSWEETIGMIIATNMEARAKDPRGSSGPPRGRGRGRSGRGRGGNRN